MFGRYALGVTPTPLNFDAQNRAIRPILIRGSTGSDMLYGSEWGLDEGGWGRKGAPWVAPGAWDIAQCP